jgi:phosphoribosylformylglycinamidine synthase
VVADIPALPLTEGCPTYEREGVEGDEVKALRAMDLAPYLEPTGDLGELFLRMLGAPNVASKLWVYRQYDSTVRTSTAVRPGGDAGVVRIRGTQRAVAAAADCNGRFVYLDPGVGARAAVAEAARNLACVGALPTAITNNLNFGNPLKPHIYHQFRQAVLGMAEGCKIFETPVTGGNVSFYNETDGRAIYPTPVIGMVGVVENVDHITGQTFRQAEDAVILLGRNTDEIGGSEYLYHVHDVVGGAPPAVDLLAERSLQQAVLGMIQDGLLHSAHDCAEGGLACALAESALGSGDTPLGVEVELDDDLPPVAALFGEANGRVVVSCAPDDADAVLATAERYGVPARRIGTVGEPGGALHFTVRGAQVHVEAAAAADAWLRTIPAIMDAPATAGA